LNEVVVAVARVADSGVTSATTRLLIHSPVILPGMKVREELRAPRADG
jgi:hypothetical protein